ncbi:hypothetical protein IQ260_22075 [Leptolyngbya cf. ectocarpi LEGE 11479]|uniref:Caspase family protein n=1 Tax=Leptolyngbya cf. ectocarpi LEGE 11479 TaxID=1828722 RepID=A0A929F8J5_LEPEC|nr:hypothetical protein [Leptolyngbya ectocarpi]MBE9069335.1 hypothetical protein [Leptolyngbya cf. ectocarpi LEGE 11479]
MAEDLFIGIAVRKPTGFEPLPAGIYDSLSRMKKWADKENYDCWIWSDENGKTITTESILQDIINKRIGDHPIDGRLSRRRRIIIYFCGHGLFCGDQIWLLSEGKMRDSSLLGVARMKAKLRQWNPKQIGFISDACAVLEHNLDQNVESPIPSPKMNPQRSDKPQYERLMASEGGNSTYAVTDGSIFTEVLLRALETSPPVTETVSQPDNAVISDLLHAYIERVFPLEDTNGKCVPFCDGGFRKPDHIYRSIPPGLVDATSSKELEATNRQRTKRRKIEAKKELDSLLLAEGLGNTMPAVKVRAGHNSVPGVVVVEHASRPLGGKKTISIPPEIFEDFAQFSPPGTPTQVSSPDLIKVAAPRGVFAGSATARVIQLDDTTNGTMLIHEPDHSFLVPEFMGSSTWVKSSVGTTDDHGLIGRDFQITPVGVAYTAQDNSGKISRLGAQLLQKFISSYSHSEFVDELIDRLSAKWVDPFQVLAVAYFSHRADKVAIFKDALRNARSDRSVPIDVALVCDWPVSWDKTTRKLSADFEGETVAIETQTPLTAYGWSLIDDANLPDFYNKIAEVRPKIGGSILPVMSNKGTIGEIDSWFKTYFSERQIIA